MPEEQVAGNGPAKKPAPKNKTNAELAKDVSSLAKRVRELGARIDGQTENGSEIKDEILALAGKLKELEAQGAEVGAKVVELGERESGGADLSGVEKKLDSVVAEQASLRYAVQRLSEDDGILDSVRHEAGRARYHAQNAERAALRSTGLGTHVWNMFVDLAPEQTAWRVVYFAGAALILLVVAGEVIGWWTGTRWCRVSSLFTEAPIL